VDYVMFLSWKQGVTRDQQDGALIRRAGWQYPDGITVHGEWWPATVDPAVVVAFETESYAPIMEVIFGWGDVFDITVHPAVSAEEGMRIGPDAMAKRQG
jgi:hypothetical protein